MFIRSVGLVVTLAGVMLIGSLATAAPQAPPPGKGKPSKVAYIVEQFAGEVGRARAAGRSAARLSNPVLHARDNGSVELLFNALGQLKGNERQDLVRLGATIVTTVSTPPKRGHPGFGLVQAWVPHNRVDDAAALDWVAAVTPPGYSEPDNHPTNPTNSEGVAFHNANAVQTRGINGAGVNVGVISDGITTIASSDLPAVTNLGTGSGDEGTAMLEIVHDMAPGAGLLFNATGGGVANHINALNNLVANGANVITEDIPFDAEPAFQVGQAAQTAENIVAINGVSIHSSAGNQALRHTARVTATGTGGGPDGNNPPGTPTGCANDPDNVVAIAPGGDTTFDVTLGNGGGSFTLQWSEPRAIFPTAGQGGFTDLNIYVMNAALTQCLAQSAGVQAFGVGDTIEQVGFPAGIGQAAKVVVDVQGTSNALAAPILDLRGRGWTAIDGTTRAGSLNPDSNYLGQATSAAALDAQNAGAIEAYSSGGPVQIITTTRCNGLAPCVGIAPFGSPVAGANTTANGPTWAAADDVTVTGVGGFGSPFTGTSAAAPHAAGCDALLRDELNNAGAAPATTNARLIATAADVGPGGTDTTTGAGRLDCLQAINDPPVADAGGPYGPTPEGTNVTLNATGSSDPDTGDSLTYSWDLDNNGTFGDAVGATPLFAAGQDGVYTVRVRVTDTAGATDTDSATVTVTNVAPSVNNLASDSPKPEGSPLTVTGTISDPGWLENLTATINWGDGSPVQTIGGTLENTRPDATLTFSVSHTYLDDNATDTYNATICGFDDDTSTCAPLAVTVFNVPPVVGAITAPTGPVQIGSPISTSATFTDAGVLDTHTAVWNWGDSSTSAGTVSEASGSGSVSGTHTYTSADLYTVTLTVTDDDGGSGSSVFEFVIVFDPTKSLAVNAKIASPAGAYIANPAKTGDVFSSAGARYKSGVPSGGTSFQFNAVPLTFNATSYNWAVVTATGRGYLQGVGLVNSAPGYSFLVSVVDGTPDKYRMKIWNTAMPAIVVYDSQFGAPINAPANIPLLFGSVVLS